MNISLVTTTDGSHTIKNESTGDTYHSIHGAIQESNHVFIKNGLLFCAEQFSPESIKILEIGFGTGLNVLLTFQRHSQLGIKIEYTTLEPFPIQEEIYSQLNYDSGGAMLKEIHTCEWGRPVTLSPNFSLTKIKNEIQLTPLPENTFNVVYFDAFAPNSQPELWTVEVFSKMRRAMTAPSVLTTYCAKGEVKRNLKAAGFGIESLPGPPGKREMTRATVAV